MWYFVAPLPLDHIYYQMLGGKDLIEACEYFAEYCWKPDMPAVGIWEGSRLVGRVVSFVNEDGQVEPKVELIR